MTIITVSRHLGSFGDEIAMKVADKLNYDYIDKPEIAEALANYGLRVDDAEKFDEKGLSFWRHLSEQKKRYLYLLKAVVYDFAKKENVVIYGWGAQVLLKDVPGVLRVRITAPFEVRMRRLVKQKGHDERNAERILRTSDHDSAGYIRSYFGVDWDDEDLYDLVISTKTISVDTAVTLITKALSAQEFIQPFEELSEKLDDLILAHKVEAVVTEFRGLSYIDLYVEKGIANITGAVDSDRTKEECERAVSEIKGIKGVNTNLFLSRSVE